MHPTFLNPMNETSSNGNVDRSNRIPRFNTDNPYVEIHVVRALRPFYKVIKLISRGAFGSVYLAVDRDHRRYAIKKQTCEYREQRILMHEMDICRKLFLHPRSRLVPFGIPRMYNYLRVDNNEYLIMEELGDSLEDKKEALRSKKFSKKTALMIGIQVVRRLQMLHENNILHRDIKPGNLVMGLGPNEQSVYIIDFGLSWTVNDYTKYDPDEGSSFCGTLEYAASESLLQKYPTRGGDLESLAYSMIDLVIGKLPWTYQGKDCKRLLKTSELGKQRLSMETSILCEGFPELERFVKIVRKLRNGIEPDYNLLVQELETALEGMGCVNDGMFDWIIERSFEASTQTPDDVEDGCGDSAMEDELRSPEEPEIVDDLLFDATPIVPCMIVVQSGGAVVEPDPGSMAEGRSNKCSPVERESEPGDKDDSGVSKSGFWQTYGFGIVAGAIALSLVVTAGVKRCIKR